MELLNLGSVPLSIRVGLRSEPFQSSPGFEITRAWWFPARGRVCNLNRNGLRSIRLSFMFCDVCHI
jgi:hypothetical protein